MPPIFLGLDEVIAIHRDQIERYGDRPGIRDMALLQAAVAMPQAGVQDRYLHSDLFEMAAAYLFHIVRDHPFVDGNKRVGVVAALVFLALNGINLKVSNPALLEIVLGVVRGETEKGGLAAFFRSHSHSH